MRAPWRTSAPIAPGGKEPVDTFIRDLAAKAEVAGFDDTGSLQWLHTVSTRWLTWNFAHKRCRRKAMNGINTLEYLEGQGPGLGI